MVNVETKIKIKYPHNSNYITQYSRVCTLFFVLIQVWSKENVLPAIGCFQCSCKFRKVLLTFYLSSTFAALLLNELKFARLVNLIPICSLAHEKVGKSKLLCDYPLEATKTYSQDFKKVPKISTDFRPLYRRKLEINLQKFAKWHF